MMTICLFALVGCGRDEAFVGSWEFESEVLSISLTFNADGSGEQEMIFFHGTSLDDSFNWELSGGNILVDFGDDWVEEWSYALDGDELTIIIDDDIERVFSRVAE